MAEQGYDAEYGARPLKRAIQRLVENPLSSALLRGEFERGRHHQGGRRGRRPGVHQVASAAIVGRRWARLDSCSPTGRRRRRARRGARAATRRVAARRRSPACVSSLRPGRGSLRAFAGTPCAEDRLDAHGRGGARAPTAAAAGRDREEETMVDDSRGAPRGGRSRQRGFKELEIVAYIGEFKIVGIAHFGVGQPRQLAARLRLHPRLQRHASHARPRSASTARRTRSCSRRRRSSSSTWTRSTSSTPATTPNGRATRIAAR